MDVKLEKLELSELTQLYEEVEHELAKRRKEMELQGKFLTILEKAERNGYHFVLDNGYEGEDLNYAFAKGHIELREQE